MVTTISLDLPICKRQSKDKDAKSSKSKSKEKDGKSVKSGKSSKSAEKEKKPSKGEEKKDPTTEEPGAQNTMAGTFDRVSMPMGATIQGTGLFG